MLQNVNCGKNCKPPIGHKDQQMDFSLNNSSFSKNILNKVNLERI